ncbi:DUF4333 domain-containing protein [Brachybacterium sp. DNPG3]
MSTTSTRTRRVLAPLALAAMGALALTACSSSVSASDVEEQISTQYEAQVGTAPDEVSCDEDLPAEVDAQITCSMTVEGQEVPLTVTVTSVEDGTASFDIEVAE